MSDLIHIDEARERVLKAVRPLESEDVPLAGALDRVLAEDVSSAIDVPPFDSSAVDGFAVVAGPEAQLELIGESRAGHPSAESLRPGAAIRISTGAEVPVGATAVVPVERTEENGAGVRVEASGEGDNIRRAGEDVVAGTVLMHRGQPLGPAELGVAASVGRAELRCARVPRVALVLTGDELTAPGEPLGPGRIYGSNGLALAAQVRRAGADIVSSKTIGDDAEETRAALGRALDAADVVIVSGGVSVGPHDHVKGAFAALGVEERFWGVKLRPGKPTWFGAGREALAFGLPGNPVSSMVTFQLFVRPALAALQGGDPSATAAEAVLDETIERNPWREEAVRVRLRPGPAGWLATPTGPQGSHMLTSMLGAVAFARVRPGPGAVAAGERVEVELL